MAHHASAKKRLRNRFYKKSTRTAIKRLRGMEDQGEAEKFLPRVVSMIDRLVRHNQWHANKAANLKSGLAKHINKLA